MNRAELKKKMREAGACLDCGKPLLPAERARDYVRCARDRKLFNLHCIAQRKLSPEGWRDLVLQLHQMIADAGLTMSQAAARLRIPVRYVLEIERQFRLVRPKFSKERALARVSPASARAAPIPLLKRIDLAVRDYLGVDAWVKLDAFTVCRKYGIEAAQLMAALRKLPPRQPDPRKAFHYLSGRSQVSAL